MKPILSFNWWSLLTSVILTSTQAKNFNTPKPSFVSRENASFYNSTSALNTSTNGNLLITQTPQKTIEEYSTQSSTGPVTTPQKAVVTNNTPIPNASHLTSPTAHPNVTKTSPSAAPHHVPSKDARIIVILLVMVVVLILVLVISFRWVTRQSGPAGNAARRCSRALQDRLTSAVTAIEGCLGFSLCPQKHVQDEEEGEEEEMTENNGEVGAKKVQVDNQRENEKDEEEEEEQKDDQREESGDSSDDYSSLEGMDLRDLAKQRQGGVEGHNENKGDGEMEGAEEELTLVSLEETEEGTEDKIEDNDLTVL